jgi:energy-coupling factor transporter ATP-binding protein EcfA2
MERDIVLVSGAPGSGKSTLAACLASALRVHLLSKDHIKETLWDVFDPPAGDLQWSRQLGAAAMEVLWTLAAQSPYALLEANFRPHSDYERDKLTGLSARIVEVYCWCPPDVAMHRYEVRAAGPGHHPAHVTPSLDPALLAEFDQPVGLGTVIRVDTSFPVNIERLAEKVSVSLSVS